MSYQVLARKWRPKTFAEVVGQEHILTALTNGLKENRLHHAYLFSGTRGVGKTSIARLLAKGLNCERGITADPCGICEHCKAVEEGRFIDLIEIDAASRTKVEDTRELLDNVQYKPVQGRFKVYLIDEVHMLSRHSFNALLKTLEEPPEYVKFLLATTDPQKLPVTILSRCMQFHLKALETSQISRHLTQILTAEKIPYEEAALDKIAKAAQGSIRDALSLTDQAIAMSDSNIGSDIVNKMLGLLDENQATEIVYALQQGNGEKLMQVIQAAAEKGADWEQLLVETAEILHRIAMRQLLSDSSGSETQVDFLARHISPEDVQFFYQTLIMGRKELPFAPNRRIGAEMTLLRALAFHPKFIRTQEKDQATDSAAEVGTDNMADLPVFSSIPASSAKERHSSLSSQEAPPSDPAPVAKAGSGSTNSAVFGALAQIQKLRAQSAEGSTEKKNTDPRKLNPLAAETDKKVTELPVLSVASKGKAKGDLLDRLISINSNKTEPPPAVVTDTASPDSREDNEEEENDSAENYRWEWSNPELDQLQNTVRPSDIKQAILQEKTPELIEKVIRMAGERDEWTRLVDQLQLDNLKLIKQIALNSVVLEHQDKRLKLGLRTAQKHLLRDKSIEILQRALSEFYHYEVELNIEFNDDENLPTPLDHRRKVYQELSEEAKRQLLEDKQIALLQTTFDAKLDMESIRPV
ncbi:DNA polymerase-3 subunit gamma/tau [Mesocricetibacter intestinalis]|uniref:DNA polymerase III subunit gamma/tau n=1 Tax=Mesocricetibacter intestinalis TaxID=1521930 RepID=A0A4R6VA99_9PAST|nr:DNA polymerase III subunit gamma/tau [Mesocricetibacter intestinalis]TDQ56970.1 DNA polymerase-3 subunit gamma/tau [Mesocricetibacter intestinalis]